MMKLLTTLALLALPVFSQVTTLKQATPNTPYLKPISSGDGAVLTDKGTYEYVDKVYDANGFTTFDTNGVYRTDFETALIVTDTETADSNFQQWERGVFVSGTNSYLVEYGSTGSYTNLILSSIVDGVFVPIATNAYQGATVSDRLVTVYQDGTNVVFQKWTGTTPTTVGTLTNGYSTYLSVNKLQYANGTYTFAKYPSQFENLATIYSSSNLVDWAITSSNKPTPIVYNSAFYAIGVPYNTYTYTTNNTSVPQTNNFTIVSTNGLIISTNTYTIVTTNVVTSVSTNTTYVNNTFRSDNGRTWTAYNTVAASYGGIKSYKSAQDMYVRLDAYTLLDGTTYYSDNDITYTSAGTTLYGGALPFNGRWYTTLGITTDFLSYTTVGYDTTYTAMIGITHDNYLITIDALTPAYQSMQLLKTPYLLTGNVNAAITTHNEDETAHPFIQDSISNKLSLADMTNGVVPTMVGPDAFAESNSVAIGNGARALSGNSLAIGPGEFSGTYDDDGLPIYTTRAFAGTNSIALNGTASGADSVTVGGEATGDQSTSIGKSAIASALGALALGSYAVASDPYAVALGTDASAFGGGASALGRAATAIGGASIAIGPNSSAGDAASSAIGYGASVPLGMPSTVEVGEGTAVSNGWFHYRGKPIIMTDTGRVFGPTGEYTTPEQHATKLTATWNTEFNTYDISLLNGVVGQLFQENHVYVKNKSGYILEEGRAVKIMGSVGDQVLAGYASSDDQQSKWCTIGIITSTGGIANDTNGYVTTFGNVNDLDTTGLTVSNAVWLSTNGFLTTTEPNITSVTSKVNMGMVLREHGTQGRIFVSVKTVPNWVDTGAYAASNPDGFIDANTATNIVLGSQQFNATLYGWGSVPSDLAGAYLLTNGVPTGPISVITNTATTNLAYVARFATTHNQRWSRITEGGINVRYHAYKGAAGAANTSAEIYITDTNGTKIVEYDTGNTRALGTSATDNQVDIFVPIPSNVVWQSNYRLEVRIKAYVTSGAPTIYIQSEDSANFVVSVPVPSADFVTQGQMDSAISYAVNPVPLDVTTNMVLYPNTITKPVTCSNQAFVVSISNTGYLTGQANAIYTEILWYTNGTSMVWPTNITWMAATNAPTFADGKRYQVFLSKIEDVGNWLGSVSGAFQ
jgi:hypothetical protein